MATWDNDYEINPEDSDNRSAGAGEIRSGRVAVRERLAKEHVTKEHADSAGALADDGWHLKGSAKTYWQTATPTNTPDAGTALTSRAAKANGRLWVQSSDHYMYGWSDSVFIALKTVTGVTISDSQTIGGIKTFASNMVLQSDLTVSGAVLLGSTLKVSGAVSLYSTFNVKGAAVLSGAATLIGNVTLSGALNLPADVIAAEDINGLTGTGAVDLDNIPDSASYQKVAAAYADASGRIDRLYETTSGMTIRPKFISVSSWDMKNDSTFSQGIAHGLGLSTIFLIGEPLVIHSGKDTYPLTKDGAYRNDGTSLIFNIGAGGSYFGHANNNYTNAKVIALIWYKA